MLKALQKRLAESREAFSSVFTNPNLRRVELSWAGTVCAYWIFIVSLSLYAYERGGASAVGWSASSGCCRRSSPLLSAPCSGTVFPGSA
jgi:hypothetical protein